MGVLCLAAFAACSDDHSRGLSHETETAAGGSQSVAVACPTALAELQQLEGKPCDAEGSRCIYSELVPGYVCSNGTWTPLESGAPSGGEGGRIAEEEHVLGLGGAGEAGTATAEGGVAIGGEGGVNTAGEGGAATTDEGGAGIAGEGAVEAPPLDATSIVLLDLDQRPYTECATYKIGAEYARDSNGIPLKFYRNNFYYNPVLIAQAGLEWLACYHESNDAWYLEQARKAGHFLVSTSADFDGSMLFPYRYDFYLHGSNANVIRAPWYSGMAQGQVLSLLSRLGDLTKDAEWEVAASATMKSFDRRRGSADPWITDVDQDNSLWIEEYATAGETHVLNGFMFALFGLYDYYAWRGDEHAAEIFRQGIYTLRVNVEKFRNPGDVSAYCLAHRVQSTSYHAVHIGQLDAISRMTNDPYFASVSDLLVDDYSPSP